MSLSYDQVSQANALIGQLKNANAALALCKQVNTMATPPILAQVVVAIQVGDGQQVVVPINIDSNVPLLTSAMETLAQVFEDQITSIQQQLSALSVTPTATAS